MFHIYLILVSITLVVQGLLPMKAPCYSRSFTAIEAKDNDLVDPVVDLKAKKIKIPASHFLFVKSSESVEDNESAALDPPQFNFADSMDLRFTVFGEPVPLTRHRLAQSGAFARMYNPSAVLQMSFAKACSSVMPHKPFEGPLRAHLVFYFQRPKSHYRTGKYSHLLKPGAPTYHCGRKDLDNLVKFVLDALNAKVYVDDSQIVEIRSAKLYTNSDPRIEVGFEQLHPVVSVSNE